MTKSKVFFTNMRVTGEENTQAKLTRLVKTAGIEQIDFDKKFAAIKIHFGELGNLAYLRPNYAKTIVDIIKSKGGKAFLTDCSTLYVGTRKNALDHIDTAYTNGFSPFSTGCHVIIADGLKGTDEMLVPVPNGELCKEAKIGRAVMDADIIISLNHFKGHELTGIGGAIKNLGMGCGSRAGKMDMHSAGKPEVAQDSCIGCRKCVSICDHSAINIDTKSKKASIDNDKCVGCGRCMALCPVDAIDPQFDAAFDVVNKKISEYSAAILNGKPHFHISLAIDISPVCDCHSESDVPIVADIGMFASFDPVALDLACAEAANKLPPNPGSVLANCQHKGRDHFESIAPGTNWRTGIDHAAKMGIGSTEYELITI